MQETKSKSKLLHIEELKNIIQINLEDKTQEFKRVFHGRGNYYEDFKYLTVDSIDEVLFVVLFEEIDDDIEKELLNMLESLYDTHNFKTFILQRRYLLKSPSVILKGEEVKEMIAIENGLKYAINFFNKNIGFFPDMKNGREFIFNNAKNKKVLNLFSYTCAFSISASKGQASQVVNVDMAKGALTIGRQNHHLNDLNTSNISFMPYNILKSWNRIKKFAPYDIIIIDPPSFQKGSFAATSDYDKIIKRLDTLASEDCIILSALNAPELDTNFIKNIFSEYAPTFKFIQRLDNLETFPTDKEEKTLKNLIFKNKC